MIISCPNCFARYTLPQGALPDEGRKVRCSSCSNTWHATPDEVEVPVIEPVSEPVSDPVMEPVEEVVVSDDTADKLAAIRSAMEEEAAEDSGGDEAGDVLDEEKLDIEEEADSSDLDPDNFGFDDEEDVDPAMEGGTSDPDEIDDRFADDPDLDDDDDDLEFGESAPAEGFDEDEDFDDVVTRRRRKQREEAEERTSARRSQAVTIGWVFLVLFVGTVFALFVAVPDKVVKWWPATQGLYDTVGMSSEPGEVHADVTAPIKVEIKIYPTEYITVDDKYTLPLKGKFVNMGTRTVSIPRVSYLLTDNADEEVAKGSFCLPNRMIMKNNSLEFEHIVENPPVNVAKVIIDLKRETNAQGQVVDSCAQAG